MTLKRLAVTLGLLLIPVTVHSQSDPQAVTLATQALAALDGTTPVSDVTLTGTATRTAGSDIESGNITLKALQTLYSRYDLTTSSSTRTEVRNVTSAGLPQGYWVNPDGSAQYMAAHNCLTGAVWFFPALSSLNLVTNPAYMVSYIGLETRNGNQVQHIRFALIPPSTAIAFGPTAQTLSTTDVYLDPTSTLPVAIAFFTHAQTDAGINIPVEIDFSNYQQVNGVQIPFHVQKLLNGTLFLDVTIQSAVLNSGIPTSAF
jgi:hypothetical protein